jgi:hypothetical protein
MLIGLGDTSPHARTRRESGERPASPSYVGLIRHDRPIAAWRQVRLTTLAAGQNHLLPGMALLHLRTRQNRGGESAIL